MYKKRLFVASAAVMLGISSIAIPQAMATTVSTSDVAGSAVMPDDATGVLTDGTSIARLPIHKTYTVDGEDYDMVLTKATIDGKTQDSQGRDLWGYYIQTKNGDNSDACRIDLHSKSVNDTSLFESTRNGFLYNLGTSDGASNPNSENIHTAVQHWGGSWRIPVAFGEALSNFTMKVSMPKEWGKPTLASDALYTTGSGTGARTYDLVDGSGTFDVSEFLTVLPYDGTTNQTIHDTKEAGKTYPTDRVHAAVDNWVEPTVTDDPSDRTGYTKLVTIKNVPAGTRFVLQWDQANTTSDVTLSDVQITADKPSCYGSTTVTQGTSSTVNGPELTGNLASATFSLGDGAPSWVAIDPKTGQLTLTPGYDVPATEYSVPITVTYEDGSTVTVYEKVTVVQVTFDDGYDDSYVDAGDTIQAVYPQTREELPADSTFELKEAPEGWKVTVDKLTGKITAEVPAGTANGDYQITVKWNYSKDNGEATTQVLTETVHVAPRASVDGYSDSYTGPGEKTVVYPQVLGTLPAGTTFALGTVPTGWDVTIDEKSGKLTVIPAADAVPGRTEIPVTVTYPNGTTVEVTAGINVDKRVTSFEVNQAGDLIVKYNGDSTGTNLGHVVGPEGQQGDGIKLVSTTTDAAGNTVITFAPVINGTVDTSQSQTITVSKGDKGDPGKDADPLTVKSSTVDAAGNTTVTFSDDSTIVIPGGKSVTITGTSTDEKTGDVTITFSTGETVTIPAGKNGTDGKDGKDATPLTIASQTVDPTTGQTIITFSDGSVVKLDPAKPATIVNQEIIDGKVVLTYSNGDKVEIPLPAKGSDGKSVTIINQTTNSDGSVDITFSDGTKVTVPAAQAPTIKDQTTDANGNTVITWTNGQTVTIPKGADGKNGTNGSSVNDKCLPAGLTVGLPLLLLIPVGMATQMNIPGLSPMMAQINSAIADANTQLQKQLGIFNQQTASFLSQFNIEAGNVGQAAGGIAGGLAAVAVGLLAANYLMQSCSADGKGFLDSSSTKTTTAAEPTA